MKVHQLNASWPATRKASYVRHAVREYEIHKSLQHTNIVALVDIFEIDANTFATVLELCTGGDLDTYLKEHQESFSWNDHGLDIEAKLWSCQRCFPTWVAQFFLFVMFCFCFWGVFF